MPHPNKAPPSEETSTDREERPKRSASEHAQRSIGPPAPKIGANIAPQRSKLGSWVHQAAGGPGENEKDDQKKKIQRGEQKLSCCKPRKILPMGWAHTIRGPR